MRRDRVDGGGLLEEDLHGDDSAEEEDLGEHKGRPKVRTAKSTTAQTMTKATSAARRVGGPTSDRRERRVSGFDRRYVAES
jgi:hypothetical protein